MGLVPCRDQRDCALLTSLVWLAGCERAGQENAALRVVIKNGGKAGQTGMTACEKGGTQSKALFGDAAWGSHDVDPVTFVFYFDHGYSAQYMETYPEPMGNLRNVLPREPRPRPTVCSITPSSSAFSEVSIRMGQLKTSDN